MKGNGKTFFARAAISAAILLVAAILGSVGGLRAPDPAQAAPPPNDNFPGTTVGAVPYSDTQDTTMATSEAGEPLFCGANTMTAWYSFIIPVSGAYAFDTFGSDFATTVNLFTGASLPSLGSVGCVGISHNSFQSLAIFGAVAGTVVRVQVAGNAPVSAAYRTSGSMRLHITRFDGTYRTVNSANDIDDGTCDGAHCSFREAINAANSNTDTSFLNFSIASGPQTITLGSALPAVSTRTIIDGSTQPGATTVPIIEINATASGGNGLTITAGNTLVTGLVINRAPGYGIELSGGGGNVIHGNFIGMNAAGTAASANVTGGININGVPDNVIGAGLDRQVLSGNGSSAGVRIAGAGATGNRVQGNFIGTNAAGTAAIGNAFDGVLVQSGATATLVGGTNAGYERNVISGNGGSGVFLASAGSGNNVIGNYIGTNMTATAAVGNALHGVRLGGTAGALIGGTTAAERNIISGNGFSFSGSGVVLDSGSSGNTVRGNWIGLQSDGVTALGNSQAGILIDSSPSNNIGDPANPAPNLCVGGCNLISSNNRGIEITGAASTLNVLRHNVGINNTTAGLLVRNGAHDNAIGTATTGGFGGLFSGNGTAGIEVRDAGTDNNTVMGMTLGADRFATSPQPNVIGIHIHDGPTNTIVGGTIPFTESNLISGNSSIGVFIENSNGNIIRDNGIGVDGAATGAIPNVQGVRLSNADTNVIGGVIGNVISGNSTFGIVIDGGTGSSDGNTVSANFIGTTITGNAALPNLGGVAINQPGTATANTIGGPAPTDRNVISGNTFDGIYLFGVTGNTVRGNLIGIRLDGTGALSNGANGVKIDGAAGMNTIGPDNVISGNIGRGVTVTNNSDGNTVANNLIGTNPAATGALGNLQGVLVNLGSDNTQIYSNTIGGNGDGMELSGVDGTLIYQNTIGTTAAPNTNNGVYMSAVTSTFVGLYGANTIAYNGARGMVLVSGSGVSFSDNSVHSNGGLGADLNNDGVSLNDPGDADAGANGTLNFPVVTVANSGITSGSLIQGTLNSLPNTNYYVALYANTSCDPSGYGEAQTFLDYLPVTTDGSGFASFSVASASPLPLGGAVTAATVDQVTYDTSEFSLCKTVTACAGDQDCDGFLDPAATVHQGPANTNTAVDNCTALWNPTQLNSDANFLDNSPPYAVTTDDKTDPNSDALGDECDSDDDNDGIPDATETDLASLQAICPTALAITDPLKLDSDNDRVTDRAECIMGTDPNNIASKPANPPVAQDPDNDKLSNAVEAIIGTNPNLFDTDGDGINDGLEFKGWRSNPLVSDTDGDGTRDRCEMGSINGDTVVNPGDQALLSAELVRAVPATSKLPHFDINKDTAYNPGDQALQASMVGPGKCP